SAASRHCCLDLLAFENILTVEVIVCLRCCSDFGGGVLDGCWPCDRPVGAGRGALRPGGRLHPESGRAAGSSPAPSRRLQPGDCRSDRWEGGRSVTRKITRVVGLVLALL